VEQLSIAEMARKGGLQTLTRYGSEHFKKIGLKGGQRTKELHQQHFKEWGARGGRPVKRSLAEITEGERVKKKEAEGPAQSLSPSTRNHTKQTVNLESDRQNSPMVINNPRTL
jgi:hypothetical protein